MMGGSNEEETRKWRRGMGMREIYKRKGLDGRCNPNLSFTLDCLQRGQTSVRGRYQRHPARPLVSFHIQAIVNEIKVVFSFLHWC